MVFGFPWCKTEPKTIGTAGIVSKLLCRKHNSLLSPVDAGGAHAFHALEASQNLGIRRGTLTPQPWMRVCFSIDGPLFERWFLKTTVNLVLATNSQVRWAAADGDTGVPERLVRLAYGKEPFAKPLGLYLCARVGQDLQFVDGLGFMPLFDHRNYLAAALYEFRGVRFILNLIDSALPQTLPEMPGRAAPWSNTQVHYHLNRINNDVSGYRSHFVDFEWPDSNFNHFAA